jgi:hypothetical protein
MESVGERLGKGRGKDLFLRRIKNDNQFFLLLIRY